MKRLDLRFFFILLFFSCNNAKISVPKYVEFAHSGIVRKVINPLIISREKMVIQLNKKQLTDLEKIIQNRDITDKDKEDYINIKYNLLLTNYKTLNLIYKFILSHKALYITVPTQSNPPDTESFSVTIDGVSNYTIYYKFKDKFFNELKNYLIKNSGDNRVVKQISLL